MSLTFLDYHLGQMTCRNCGIVVQSQIVSDEAEWREFAENDRRRDDPNRVGGPENSLYGTGSLSTMMGKDKEGNMSALSEIHNRAAVSANQAVLAHGYQKADTFGHKLGVKESAVVSNASECFTPYMETSIVCMLPLVDMAP